MTFSVAHVDLYFSTTLMRRSWWLRSLPTMCRLYTCRIHSFASADAIPRYWERDGHGGHCPEHVEWLSTDGTVLAVSDYDHREKYLSFVCQHRSLSLASHWEFLLEPLMLHHSDKAGLIRYRQLEYHLMPVMAYLALDDPGALTRGEFARVGFGGGTG